MHEVLFGGARGGGKSDGLLGDFTSQAARYGSHARGLLVRRTMTELDEIKRRAQELFPPAGCRFYKSENAWEYPGGARLALRYLESDDDATRYHGHQYTWLGVDEAGNFPRMEPIDMLSATLRSAHGVPTRMRLTANPGGKGHSALRRRFRIGKPGEVIKADKPGDPDTPCVPPLTPFVSETGAERVYIPSRLSDNKILTTADPTYAQRLRASGPAWLVKAWLEGDWSIAVNGTVFPREGWRYYATEPGNVAAVIQSWDTAYRTRQTSDRSVCTTWAWVPGVGYYLLHMWAGRVGFAGLQREVVRLATAFTELTRAPVSVLIEDTPASAAVLESLQRDTALPVLGVRPQGDKLARAWAITPAIEAGRVFIPTQAPWLSDFLEETGGFPNVAHDDVVDSLTQALAYMLATYTVNGGDYRYERVDMRQRLRLGDESAFDNRELAPPDWRFIDGVL